MERWAHPDTTPPAPGDMELVRAFVSLHDHEPDNPASLPPSHATIAGWLKETGLLEPTAQSRADDLDRVAEVLEALRTKVSENTGAEADPRADATLDAAIQAAGVRPTFGPPGLAPTEGGVRGAVGRVLAIAFVSLLDGSFSKLKGCGNPACRAVFYDRSKNRSGRWCTMASCGNRAKVRAFRERQRAKG